MSHETTKDKVTDAVLRTRRAIQEGFPGSKRGGIDVYDPKTGTGKTSHSTDDVNIDIIVTPKEVEPTGDG